MRGALPPESCQQPKFSFGREAGVDRPAGFRVIQPFRRPVWSGDEGQVMAESSQGGAQVGRRKPAIRQCLNRKIPTTPPTAGHGRLLPYNRQSLDIAIRFAFNIAKCLVFWLKKPWLKTLAGGAANQLFFGASEVRKPKSNSNGRQQHHQ